MTDFSPRSGPVLVVLTVNESLSFVNVEVPFLDLSSTPKGFTPKTPRVKSQRPDTSTSMNNPYNCPFESQGLKINLDGLSAPGILSALMPSVECWQDARMSFTIIINLLFITYIDQIMLTNLKFVPVNLFIKSDERTVYLNDSKD